MSYEVTDINGEQLDGLGSEVIDTITHIEPMTALKTFITFAVSALVIQLIKKLVAGIIKRSRLEKTLARFLLSGINVLSWFAVIMVLAGLLGIPMDSFVALIGIAGLALSLSIQELLSNLFSGFTILGSKPFAAGDYVEMCSISGTIREVGLINTTVVMPDNRIIYIPNSSITSSSIINYTKEPRRRVDLLFSATYDSQPQDVIKAIGYVIEREERILKEPEPFIAVNSYGETSVEYIVRAWVNNLEYWDVYHNVTEQMWDSFAKNNITMHNSNRINVKLI